MLGIALALIAGYMMGSSSQEEPKFVPFHTGDTLPLVNYNTIPLEEVVNNYESS